MMEQKGISREAITKISERCWHGPLGSDDASAPLKWSSSMLWWWREVSIVASVTSPIPASTLTKKKWSVEEDVQIINPYNQTIISRPCHTIIYPNSINQLWTVVDHGSIFGYDSNSSDPSRAPWYPFCLLGWPAENEANWITPCLPDVENWWPTQSWPPTSPLSNRI